MKISDKVFKFQEGGPMPTEPAAPAEPAQAQEDPIVQLVTMAQQALQEQNCEAAMAVCEGLMQLVQGAQGGGEPTGQPVYKAGGTIVKRIK